MYHLTPIYAIFDEVDQAIFALDRADISGIFCLSERE